MDVLSDVLAVSGVSGTAGARIAACGTWGVRSSTDQDVSLYAVTAGIAFLTVQNQGVRLLNPGDVVLLPTGAAHMLSSDPGVPSSACEPGSAAIAQREGTVLRFGEGDAQTQILCAAYSHDPAAAASIFSLLPAVVHVQASAADPDLGDTIRLLGRELARPRAASGILLDRLVDILLIQLLRVWIDSGTTPDISWWGVLRDPLLHRAVTHIHEDPARDWTAESLAREVAVSKSTLNRRFLAETGETFGAYLTRWRMTLAARRLRDTDATLEVVAESVGYSSVYAFSRAFHRERRLPPARYRRTVRQSITER